MLKFKNYILLFILALTSVSVVAQRATVRVTVEPSDIYIGEQAVINLEVISPKDRNVQFPMYPDTLVKGIEVLKAFDTDTVMTEVMTLNKKYLITSFDSTLYHIPFMEVIVDKDTIRSNDFGLKVTTPQMSEGVTAYLEKLNAGEADSIDFAQLELSDIKDIQEPKFVWTDYLAYILIPLFIILVVAGAILAYYFYKKKKEKGYFFTPKIIEPPHVVALRSLNDLKGKKLTQAGMEKEFYTELSDILRTYINQRYPSINATEMITEEILEAVHRVTDTRSPEESLSQILSLSDLVKFAKYIPLPNENDFSLANAFLFVNQTKLEEVVPPVDGKTPAVNIEGQSNEGIEEKINS